MLNEKRKEELINLCQDLVQKSINSGEEGQVVEAIKKSFKKLGYDRCLCRCYGNVIGHIKGNKPGKKHFI